jgi:hypothetical protein
VATSPEPGRLELGPPALTRAMCPPGSLHDQIAKHWSYVRSYIVKDGHLFVALMADGAIYEFEPMADENAASSAPESADARAADRTAHDRRRAVLDAHSASWASIPSSPSGTSASRRMFP